MKYDKLLKDPCG